MRYKKTRDVVIELTSLLDVVMILLFAIMIDNAKLTQVSQSELNEANAQIETMQDEMEKMSLSVEELQKILNKVENGEQKALVEQIQKDENMLQAYEYIDNVIVSINICLENKNGKRYISFGKGTDEESYKMFDVNKTDKEAWNEAMNQLKMFAYDAISNAEDTDNNRMVYLIFSADYTKVYSNDFNDIESVLMSLASENEKIVYYSNKLNNEEDTKR